MSPRSSNRRRAPPNRWFRAPATRCASTAAAGTWRASALITGGDSGIGRAVAVAFAKEGADVAINYFGESEDADAERIRALVREQGRRCYLFREVRSAAEALGGLDVLVDHAGLQSVQPDFADIGSEQFDRTFKVNVYAVFWMCHAALDHLGAGGRSSTPVRSTGCATTRA
ncbi:hypothetical protein GCM10009854_18430 [Saccharopolyspora halophila]|uniref:SDR family NAD(P)-dependent oxidoreductase n=1 Tax=Saccharopolyspora halophila TaxID=405551 RepID=A0ABP5SZB2_9PSEU